MTKSRDDQWTEQQDEILAQTIINNLENNGTQLEGFQVAAQLLQRTAAACGFRWNKEVRKRYLEEIKLAKERKAEIKGVQKSKPKSRVSEIPVGSGDLISQVTSLIEQLVTENKDLRAQVEKQESEIAKLNYVLQKARDTMSAEVRLKAKAQI
ncbi:hypothetical protein [Paenibacillus sp. UNC496MF]|uniref:hypothetical protein n=1 Tax=Paenibacillus sp. UNC496MF TaxID=1502753 RepID=UPI000A97417E|nr:hypothetical protein [Paenibacillus sp. UNC496MF]